MSTTKFTIKNDEAFSALCQYLGKDSDFSSKIILQTQKLIPLEESDCGKSLVSTIMCHELGYREATICSFLIGRSDTELCKMLNEVTIWGGYGDCPECGCDSSFFDAEGFISGGQDDEPTYESVTHQCNVCKTIFDYQQ